MSLDNLLTVPVALWLLSGLVALHLSSGGKLEFGIKIPARLQEVYRCWGILSTLLSLVIIGLSAFVTISEKWPPSPVQSSGGEIAPTSIAPTPGNVIPTQAGPIPTKNAGLGTLFNPFLGSAGSFISSFFDAINAARSREEVLQLWNKLSPDFRNISSNGNINSFADFWWSVQVTYTYQQCSTNTVDIRLTYFNIGNNRALSSDFIRCNLETINGEWQIGTLITSTEFLCK